MYLHNIDSKCLFIGKRDEERQKVKALNRNEGIAIGLMRNEIAEDQFNFV